MKKALILLLAFLLVASLAGCGIRQKIEKKMAEAVAEKVLGDVDIEMEGDSFTIKGESGEEFTFGGSEWPTSDLAKKIPKLKDGKVDSVFDMQVSLMISMLEVPEKSFKDYLEEVKKDFPQELYTMESDGSKHFAFANEDGLSVFLSYGSDQSLSINVAQQENVDNNAVQG